MTVAKHRAAKSAAPRSSRALWRAAEVALRLWVLEYIAGNGLRIRFPRDFSQNHWARETRRGRCVVSPGAPHGVPRPECTRAKRLPEGNQRISKFSAVFRPFFGSLMPPARGR